MNALEKVSSLIILICDGLSCLLVTVFLVREPLVKAFGHEGAIFRITSSLPYVLLLLIPLVVAFYLIVRRFAQLRAQSQHQLFCRISLVSLFMFWLCLALAMAFIGIVQNVADGLD